MVSSEKLKKSAKSLVSGSAANSAVCANCLAVAVTAAVAVAKAVEAAAVDADGEAATGLAPSQLYPSIELPALLTTQSKQLYNLNRTKIPIERRAGNGPP